MVEFQTFQNNFSLFVDQNYMFGCEFDNNEVSGLDARANVLQKTAGSKWKQLGQISGECDLFQMECFDVRGCCYLSERYV